MKPDTAERIFRLASHPKTPDHEALAAIRKLHNVGLPKSITDRADDLLKRADQRTREIDLMSANADLRTELREASAVRYGLERTVRGLREEIAELKKQKRLQYVERLEQRVADRDREILDLEREIHGVRDRTSPLTGRSWNDN